MTSQYREWAVAGAGAVIACRWEQRIDRDAPRYVQRVLPDGCADVVVTEGGRAVVVGPTGEAALPELAPGTTVLGLRIRTEAIGAAFGVPGSELRDRVLPLDEVMGTAPSRHLVTALLAGEDWGDQWAGKWAAGVGVDRRTAAAVRQLWTGAADVAAVAAVVGLSGRQLRRVLLADVGLGPKSLQRIGRLQRFLALAEQYGSRGGLAQWAALAGYADQSHLSRDVAELTATTPARLLAERLG